LEYILRHLDAGQWSERFKALNHALCEVVTDYSLVAFTTLNVQDKACMLNLLQLIDKSNGYLNLSVEENQFLALMNYSVNTDFDSFQQQEVQEKYIDIEPEPE
jgi:hypothetical protein